MIGSENPLCIDLILEPKARRTEFAVELTLPRVAAISAAAGRRQGDYRVAIRQQRREIAIGVDQLLEEIVALGAGGLLELLSGDLVLQAPEAPSDSLIAAVTAVLVALADDRIAHVLPIAFPYFVVSLEREVASVDDDDDPVLKRRKSAGLREVAPRLFELHLAVDGMKDAIVRTG